MPSKRKYLIDDEAEEEDDDADSDYSDDDIDAGSDDCDFIADTDEEVGSCSPRTQRRRDREAYRNAFEGKLSDRNRQQHW